MKIMMFMLLLVAPLLTSCINDHDDDSGVIPEDNSVFYREYSVKPPYDLQTWWNRENFQESEYEEVKKTCIFERHGIPIYNIDLVTVIRLSDELFSKFTYKSEKWSYWQSSQETLSLMSGDCEDYHILLLIQCLNAGLPIGKFGIVMLCERSSDRLHAAMCIYPDPDKEDFLVLNYNVLKWIKDMPEYYPAWGFDLHTVWVYKY